MAENHSNVRGQGETWKPSVKVSDKRRRMAKNHSNVRG